MWLRGRQLSPLPAKTQNTIRLKKLSLPAKDPAQAANEMRVFTKEFPTPLGKRTRPAPERKVKSIVIYRFLLLCWGQ